MSTPSPSTTSSFTTSISSRPSLSGPRYHPDFTASSGLDADVTLVARDGMRFRINATAFRLASAVFAAILSLPQSAETERKDPVIDTLDEDSEVLEVLVRIISGNENLPNRLLSLDALQPCLLAAERWDIRGALSIMRGYLLSTPDISSDPMRVYWLGSRFGWKDVMSAASKHSCRDYLGLPADKRSSRGNICPTDYLRLMKFHKDRKDQMDAHLFGDIPGRDTHDKHSSRCWRMGYVARRVLKEMDHTPPACRISNDKLRLFIETTQTDSCDCHICEFYLRSSEDIIKEVQSHWDRLPEKLPV